MNLIGAKHIGGTKNIMKKMAKQMKYLTFLLLNKATGVENLADYREKFIIGASFSSSNSLNISLAPNQPPASVIFLLI